MHTNHFGNCVTDTHAQAQYAHSVRGGKGSQVIYLKYILPSEM